MDRPVIIGFDFGVDLVHGVAEDVEDTAKTPFPTGTFNRVAGVFGCHAADEAICGVHGNAADDVVT